MITVMVSCLRSLCYADNYVVNSIGNFDYVSSSSGYSGVGQRIGNFYYYRDNNQ